MFKNYMVYKMNTFIKPCWWNVAFICWSLSSHINTVLSIFSYTLICVCLCVWLNLNPQIPELYHRVFFFWDRVFSSCAEGLIIVVLLPQLVDTRIPGTYHHIQLSLNFSWGNLFQSVHRKIYIIVMIATKVRNR